MISRLKVLRAERNWSQADLAESRGFPPDDQCDRNQYEPSLSSLSGSPGSSAAIESIFLPEP
jgi:transcriptional regulator with XRE-family HTH domain